MSKNLYSYPVKKWQWASRTASPYHTSKRRMQFAIDFGVPVGTPVYAAFDGIVDGDYTGTDKDGYIEITLDHAHKEYTDYGHLSKVLVKGGQKVRRGQLIGLSGASGDMGGLPSHCHFEVGTDVGRYLHTIPITWASNRL